MIITPRYFVRFLDGRAEQFDHIQDAIDNGMCFVEEPFRVKFLYVRDDVRPEIYFLLIKANRARTELWLVTFHRITKKQFDSRLAAPGQIQVHTEKDFMG